MLANQRHELARTMFFDFVASFRLDYTHKSLRLSRFAGGDDQAAADFQLRHQRFGYLRPSGGRDRKSTRLNSVTVKSRMPSSA